VVVKSKFLGAADHCLALDPGAATTPIASSGAGACNSWESIVRLEGDDVAGYTLHFPRAGRVIATGNGLESMGNWLFAYTSDELAAATASAGAAAAVWMPEMFESDEFRLCLKDDAELCLRTTAADTRLILGQKAGDKSRWNALCPTGLNLPPAPPPLPPTPPPPYGASDGAWYFGPLGGNCNTACSDAGLECNLEEARSHFDELDTKDTFRDEVRTMTAHHRGVNLPASNFNCVGGFVTQNFAAMPSVRRSSGKCFAVPTDGSAAHTCAANAASEFQRLCRCTHISPSSPPPSPISPPPSPPPPSPPPPSPPPPSEH